MPLIKPQFKIEKIDGTNFITSEGLMNYLRLSKSTIKRLVAKHKIYSEVIGRQRYFRLKDVLEYLATLKEF